MSARPLTAGGGEATRYTFRLDRTDAARLDELAQRRGFSNRSEYVRALIADELASAGLNEEDASKAS